MTWTYGPTDPVLTTFQPQGSGYTETNGGTLTPVLQLLLPLLTPAKQRSSRTNEANLLLRR